MGLHKVWDTLQQFGEDVALPRLHEQFRADPQHSGPVRIGVDFSIWIIHAERVALNVASTSVVRILFYRLCRVLALPQLDFVFVFDGPNRPPWKRGKQSVNGSDAGWDAQGVSRYARQCQDLIRAFGFRFLYATGEAEATLADMCKRNLIDAVMSDDADCFAFGAHRVVRSWSNTLSGSQARATFIGASGAREPSSSPFSSSQGSEDDADSKAPSEQDDLAIDPVSLRKKDNLVTVYRTDQMASGFELRDNYILWALLVGGDYSMAGLPNCGEKVASAMIKAGFGTRLIKGAREHLRLENCSSARRNRRLHRGPGWSPFIDEWRQDVLDEMRTNSRKLMKSTHAALARAEASQAMFTTDESLEALAHYIWPDIVDFDSDPLLRAERSSTGVDVEGVAKWMVLHLHHGPERAQESLRNSVWAACAARHANGDLVKGLWSGAVEDREDRQTAERKSRALSPTIKSYFTSAAPVIESSSGSSALKVLREQKSASTGHLREVYVEFHVAGLVKLAEAGVVKAQREKEDRQSTRCNTATTTPQSSQASSTAYSSPRKPKKPVDISKPVRAWLPREAIERCEEGRAALRAFEELKQARQRQEDKKSARKAKETLDKKQQPKLDTFFGQSGKRATASVAAVKAAQSAILKDLSGEKDRPEEKGLVGELDKMASAVVVRSASVSPSKRRAARPSRSSVDREQERKKQAHEAAKLPLGQSPQKQKAARNGQVAEHADKEDLVAEQAGKLSPKRPPARPRPKRSGDSDANPVNRTAKQDLSIITISDDSDLSY